jgi:hypothetical protein
VLGTTGDRGDQARLVPGCWVVERVSWYTIRTWLLLHLPWSLSTRTTCKVKIEYPRDTLSFRVVCCADQGRRGRCVSDALQSIGGEHTNLWKWRRRLQPPPNHQNEVNTHYCFLAMRGYSQCIDIKPTMRPPSATRPVKRWPTMFA